MIIPRNVRDQLPDDCLGSGQIKPILDCDAARCSSCSGTGEVLRESVRRRRSG